MQAHSLAEDGLSAWFKRTPLSYNHVVHSFVYLLPLIFIKVHKFDFGISSKGTPSRSFWLWACNNNWVSVNVVSIIVYRRRILVQSTHSVVIVH